MREHGLSQRHDPLLDAGDGALEDDEVVLDFAVTNETAHATMTEISIDAVEMKWMS